MAKYLRLFWVILCACILLLSTMACKLLNRLTSAGGITASSQPILETVSGTLVIAEVEISDRFPPECGSFEPHCLEARDGYQIVILWLENQAGGNWEEISDNFFGEAINYLGEDNDQAYLTAEDGAHCVFASIRNFLEDERIGLAFGAPEGSHGYRLTWPGSPEIELEK